MSLEFIEQVDSAIQSAFQEIMGVSLTPHPEGIFLGSEFVRQWSIHDGLIKGFSAGCMITIDEYEENLAIRVHGIAYETDDRTNCWAPSFCVMRIHSHDITPDRLTRLTKEIAPHIKEAIARAKEALTFLFERSRGRTQLLLDSRISDLSQK